MPTYSYRVKQVPRAATESQVQTALNNADNQGFEFVGLFTLGTGTAANFYAVFRKEVNKIL